MADVFDLVASPTPQMTNKPSRNSGRPTMAALRTSLQALVPGTYTDAVVRRMTYNDRVSALRVGK
jgi:hypothetical protein